MTAQQRHAMEPSTKNALYLAKSLRDFIRTRQPGNDDETSATLRWVRAIDAIRQVLEFLKGLDNVEEL
ncbi:MAG: hypothetical protein ACLPID_13280 [Beijerinckiaceae bacterium]